MADPATPKWPIVPLAAEHVRPAFNCGKLSLDAYLKNYALQNQKKNVSRTFVALHPGSNRIAGYYTVSSGSVAFEVLHKDRQKGLTKYPIPVVHVGRLAVDRSAQGQRLGELLLMDALQRAKRVATAELGICGVEVCALDEQARTFYLKYGFTELADDKLHLYLLMSVIMRLGLLAPMS